MRLIATNEGVPLKKSDAPWLGSHILILRSSAVNAIGDLLKASGELLPVRAGAECLNALNVTAVVDALDRSASSIKYFEDGRVMLVDKYVLSESATSGYPVFKIAGKQPSPIFVRQEFVDRWKSAGLQGLQFETVSTT
jgi:hypothetical protein